MKIQNKYIAPGEAWHDAGGGRRMFGKTQQISQDSSEGDHLRTYISLQKEVVSLETYYFAERMDCTPENRYFSAKS